MREWLVKVRKEKSRTQKQIADKVGVTRQMIGAIEKGTATPRPSIAKRIAEILDFDWTLFYEDSGQEKSKPA